MAIALPRRRAIVLGGIFVVGGALVLGGLFILTGLYNVAASVKHFRIPERLIELTLRRSVATHSILIKPPNLDRPDLVHVGALHYANGCEVYHAAPGVQQNPIVEGMYPSPPSLQHSVQHWDDNELFWIVRHGLKFTGMPQWAGVGRDDEVWAVVAFLRTLPVTTPDAYARMTRSSRSGSGFLIPPDAANLLEECAACHGRAGQEPIADLVPSLNGQRRPYLRRALREYAADERQSGMMEPLASALSPRQIEWLADAFASRPRMAAGTHTPPAPEAQLERGKEIALHGMPQQNLPACISCHGEGRAELVPAITGLSETYLANQIVLFQKGIRASSGHAQIMRRVAERLTGEQIRDVSAYLARRSNWPSQRQHASGEELP